MRITRLRLSGFKSFVEPTELRIEPGLTGVVGPNGCGKSNLLEAIRWVMGESSPKSMRGGGMDDVIFAGTETRPSRDFAEVMLVCESHGATLPGLAGANDGETLEVVRRIERGAGSAYRANGHDVRAKDVSLIFADAATGAHSPALVSQGKVAAIIAAKPQERRQLLEEAAGIAGLHVRRKDAEQKLRTTETNLSRVGDMLTEMEARAGALRRQARAAERYTRLSDQIRVAEGRMIYARWRDAAAAADAARSEAAAAEIAVEAAATEQRDAAASQAEGVVRLASAREEAGAARDAEHSLSARLATLRSERQTVAHRIADFVQEADRIARDCAAEGALAREGAQAIDRLDETSKQVARQIAAREKDRPALEARQTGAADLLRDADVALAQARAEAANESAERRIAEAALAEADRRLARIDADAARLVHEAALAGNGDHLTAEAERREQAALAAMSAIEAAESELTEAHRARDQARAAAEASDAVVAEARSALAALTSEAAAIERSLAASQGGGPQLLDSIRAETGYEAALAAALADDLMAPLLGEEDGGARGWRGATPRDGDPDLAAGLEPLSQRVTAPAALARRLAQVGIADVDSGQWLHVGQRLVTLDGSMRRWDGFVAHGDGAASAERLARIGRRAALAAQLPMVEEGLAHLLHGANAAAMQHAATEAALVAARTALTRHEEDARAARRAADLAGAALERFAATQAHVAERQAAVQEDRALALTAHTEVVTRVADLPDGAAMATLLATRQQAADAARAVVGKLRDAMGELERDLAKLREAGVEAQAEARGWRARSGEAARRIAALNQRLDDIRAEQRLLEGKPEALDAAIAGCEGEAAQLSGRAEAAIQAEREAAEAMTALEARLDVAREALSSAREARAGAAARADNAEGRRVEMGRISGERFSCPPPLLPEATGFDGDAVASPSDESASHERLSHERERIGPVNLVAAQELAELEAELARVSAEAEELQAAVHSLRGSIGHLNREGRTRLAAAFEQVDGHFQRLFSTLFGGGRAHLALVDSDDPLEAGLEIMAEPPGKRLATLTLLSGGEQALTAIALIFALFLTNPAPICVLDEVDAPLDDANVERFCDLLDAMVRETSTRYLIVTHNAVTMARMHRLFGVTMVERGVSRLVSVDLGSAEQLLAAE